MAASPPASLSQALKPRWNALSAVLLASTRAAECHAGAIDPGARAQGLRGGADQRAARNTPLIMVSAFIGYVERTYSSRAGDTFMG